MLLVGLATLAARRNISNSGSPMSLPKPIENVMVFSSLAAVSLARMRMAALATSFIEALMSTLPSLLTIRPASGCPAGHLVVDM